MHRSYAANDAAQENNKKNHIVAKKENGSQAFTCEPPGGLFGIDQEVVTLRGLFGNSGVSTDLRRAESILNHR
jgi:hypothetical protein